MGGRRPWTPAARFAARAVFARDVLRSGEVRRRAAVAWRGWRRILLAAALAGLDLPRALGWLGVLAMTAFPVDFGREARSRFGHNRSVPVREANNTFRTEKCFARFVPNAPDAAPRGSRLAGLLALAALFASGSDVYAQQQDSILKQAFKVFGFATDVAPPADFVNKTRPAADPDYIPVFQPPPEPARPALKSDRAQGGQERPRRGPEAARHAATGLSAGRQGDGGATGGAKKAETERSRRPAIADIPFAALGLPMLQGRCRRIESTNRDNDPRASGCDERFSPGAALAALCLRAGQQAQGQGPRRRRRHRRSRHGQSRTCPRPSM